MFQDRSLVFFSYITFFSAAQTVPSTDPPGAPASVGTAPAPAPASEAPASAPELLKINDASQTSGAPNHGTEEPEPGEASAGVDSDAPGKVISWLFSQK